MQTHKENALLKKWHRQTEGQTERLLEYRQMVETQFDTDGQALIKVAWETYMRMGRRVDKSIHERMATGGEFEKAMETDGYT
eukprot:scaffold533191_cov29-Prasinocladus_malaysianus.AAC.1